MSEYRFDGRVAVVTGAGRGIGRAHARLLGERGASVVVNDLGGSREGFGADAGPALEVVDEIVAAGGVAIADNNDASSEVGAQAIIDAAVGPFGRVDIVVNNAGIMRWADFPDVPLDDLERHIAVHTIAAFCTTRAAWPHMVDQGYGRIVMTTSTGILGLPGNLSYAAAKAALIGMARAMRIAGSPHGITINLIAPAASTRLGGARAAEILKDDRPGMPPEFVAPMVGYLAHENCTVTGEIYTAGAGRFARIFLASTEGYVQLDPAPTIEDVAQNWETINDETNYYVPIDLFAWSAQYKKHLISNGG